MISVVIPLYNKAAHIQRALDSVLAQTCPPQEIIVVDDGSTDGGGELVASLSLPLLRLIRQENQGVGAARNRGIEAAQGDTISFLDADDAWQPKYLETINYLQAKYPQAGAYATAYEIVLPDKQRYSPDFHLISDGDKDTLITNYIKKRLEFIYQPDPLRPSAMSIPKKVLQQINGFPIDVSWGEDTAAFVRIALRFPIAWSKEPLAIYFMDAENRIWGVLRHEQEPAISSTIRRELATNTLSDEEKRDLQEYAARFQLNAARDCLVLGKRDTALQLLAYARGTRLFAGEWWRWRLLAVLPGNSAHYLWKFKRFWRH